MDPLFVFLHRWSVQRFEWGVCDCILAAADWVAERTGTDPAADLRGRYGSAAECQRVTGFFTDPMGLIGPRMDAIAARSMTPARGHVGLIQTARGGRALSAYGAVALGGALWAVKSEAGVTAFEPEKVLAAWVI